MTLDSEPESLRCDLLVIGAGMAGLSAAGYAAERGATVMVIEKARSFGGSAALSGGVLWTATSHGRMQLYGGGAPELGAVVLRNYPIGIDWLRQRGVTLSPAVAVLHGRGYQIDILDHLRGCARLVEQHGGHVVLDTLTQSLLTDKEGRVIGVRTAQEGGFLDVHAKNVLIATGGYQNSPELRQKYIHPNARDQLLLRTNPASRGDGLRLAAAVGAEVRPTNGGFYGHLVSESPDWGDPRLFTQLTQYHSERSLLLNEAGLRFCDESYGDHANTNHVLGQSNARALCFWDANIHQAYATAPVVKGTEILDKMQVALERGGRGIVTSSLEEVGTFATGQGFNGEQVCRTVREYNQHSRHRWEGMTPIRGENFGALDQPPFYALIVRPAITHTHGGIRVDPAARVLYPNNTPIPGLYAAGADIDGVYGVGYAGGLAMALAFALQAVQTMGFAP
jgi:succinate dehydrogenase/fumarate reductase flavoprotein subunit